MRKLIGQTRDTSLALSLDHLGAPGIYGTLEVVPMFKHPIDSEPLPRPAVHGPRDFEIKAKLARSPSELVLNGAFSPADGASYITAAADHQSFEIEDPYGKLRLDKNSANQLSMVTALVTASSPDEANAIFSSRLSAFIDRISYLASIPIFVELTVVKDVATEAQSIFFVSPPREHVLKDGGETVHIELAPVYALYREAQNSVSPYYRVLCLFKIMEGLLGPLITILNRRAKEAGVNIDTPKARVPDHPDFPQGLRSLVGQPVKTVFDSFMRKQFRDSMAHFNLSGKAPLNVSDLLHWSRFMDVAFVANLCARVLIARHELSLDTFAARAEHTAGSRRVKA